ncbi:MAG: GtrA family protein [Eubacterium sp.]|nr:GtrA family protein [Eubacterium sp.]
MMQKIIQLILKYQELIRYVIVGGITTVVNLGMYLLLTSTVLDPENGWELQAANVIAWIAAVTVAYILNRNVVFRSKNNVVWEMVQFYAARLATLGLEMGLTWLFVTVLEWNDRIVKLMVQFVLVISNYLFSKLVIFRNRKTDEREREQGEKGMEAAERAEAVKPE